MSTVEILQHLHLLATAIRDEDRDMVESAIGDLAEAAQYFPDEFSSALADIDFEISYRLDSANTGTE